MSGKEALEKARDKATEAVDELFYSASDMRVDMGKIVDLCDDADDDNWQARVEEIRGIAGNY
jgi:hypothetical protein